MLRSIPTIIFCCITYTAMGPMANDWWLYIYKYIVLCTIFTFISLVSSIICLAISFIFYSALIFTVIINMLLIVLSLMNGVFINKETLYNPLKTTYYMSFIKFATEALYVNEFLHSTVIINPKEFAQLNVSIPVDGKFYLDQMGLDSTAMECDIFVLSMFFLGYVMILYPLFSLALCIRKKK